MNKPTVDDYLERGIYGNKEIKPEEKRRYLGTYRERVALALTSAQTCSKEHLKLVEEKIKAHKSAKLLLNGNLSYDAYSPYIKLANLHGVQFSIVNNKDHKSDLGLVLAYDYAIDKEDEEVFISEMKNNQPELEKSPKKSFWKRLFGIRD